MRSSDIISILITFVVGTVVGAYLYVFGFTQQFSFFSDLAEDTSSLTITGTGFGGCERAGVCATFQIAADGTFRTFFAARSISERERSDGTLVAAQMRELRRVFTPERLEELSQPIVPPSCASDADGIDYEFRFTVDEATYVLNTCDTQVVRQRAEFRLLQEVLSDVGL